MTKETNGRGKVMKNCPIVIVYEIKDAGDWGFGKKRSAQLLEMRTEMSNSKNKKCPD
jgi:hypothetical protein